jgi:carbon starvation protein
MLLAIVVACALLLAVAYRVYGGFLARKFELDANAPVPSQTLRDDEDFVPTDAKFLIGQHFSAIAAAGPIVGPIMAGVMFGWGPALAWILIGAILIGGVHDFASLVASIRHRATSIAELVREHVSRRAYALFLTFIWIALVYIIVAFTDITAASFVGRQTLENGEVVSGGGIATSSLIYLAIPMVMALTMRRFKLDLLPATLIFAPLIALAIWFGQTAPLDLGAMVGGDVNAQKIWVGVILLYCVVAAMMPVWLLLQPRGHLGGVFLYVALGAGALGILFANRTVQYPAFTGWTGPKGETLFPLLFITIACGACSGFHSLIASGTTSKQLKSETDAKPIGYGTMLLEAMVAVISLSCVMILASNSELLSKGPNLIYAAGIGEYLGIFGIPATFAISLALMAFTTFVYDTLDVCTRLGRYIVQELTGWQDRRGAWLGTALTAGVPLLFVLQTTLGPDGKPIPAWRTFWSLFGASNQLLAALALLGITVWLWRTKREYWVLAVVGLPALWMYVVSVWALVQMVAKGGGGPVPVVGAVLIGLAAIMMVEAVMAFFGPPQKPKLAEGAA